MRLRLKSNAAKGIRIAGAGKDKGPQTTGYLMERANRLQKIPVLLHNANHRKAKLGRHDERGIGEYDAAIRINPQRRHQSDMEARRHGFIGLLHLIMITIHLLEK